MSRIRIRALISVAAVTAVLLTGCTGERSGERSGDRGAPAGPGWPAPVEAGEQIDWQPCPHLLDELLGDVAPPGLLDQLTEQVSYECGAMSVPQDWDAPDLPQTHEIALVRARSAAQRDRIGSLVVNPGGPGGSGVDAAVLLSLGPLLRGLSPTVTERFDLVGFDPRGVARSSPVECFSDTELDDSFGADPDPVAPAEFAAAVAETRQQAEACAAEYGETLTTFSTRQTAHDLAALRAALGDEQLTYLGFSYGTLLGATFAQLYPEQVRAMVLDGAIDPRQDVVAATEAQAQGFERALDAFAQWCAGADAECPLAPDARTAVTGAIESARQAPVTGDGGREASAGWVFWAVVAALYSEELWPQLAAALERLDAGDPEGVFALADAYTRRDAEGNYDNMFDANIAINCADTEAALTVEQVRELQQQWRARYPVFGAPLATGALGCAVWPAEPDPYPTGPAPEAPPILVVGTQGDPATPYESTAGLAAMLGVGVVLTYEGQGHTAYPESPCVTDVVDAYLVELAVPTDGRTCPAE